MGFPVRHSPSGSDARGQFRLVDELNQVNEVIKKGPPVQPDAVGVGMTEVVEVVAGIGVVVGNTAVLVWHSLRLG